MSNANVQIIERQIPAIQVITKFFNSIFFIVKATLTTRQRTRTVLMYQHPNTYAAHVEPVQKVLDPAVEEVHIPTQSILLHFHYPFGHRFDNRFVTVAHVVQGFVKSAKRFHSRKERIF